MRETPRSTRALASEVWQLLDAAQKRQCVAVLLICVLAAGLTLVGVAGITPVFAVLADAGVVDSSRPLSWLRDTLAIETSEGFLICLGVGFVVLLSVANLANFLALLSIGRFSQGVGARLHSLLFDEYLHRGLRFHSRSNSAVLAAHVVQDVTRTVGGIIYGGLTLWAGLVGIVLITGTVIVVDPLVAAAAVALLSASYALIHAFVRHRLVRNGTLTTNHWHWRAQVIAESFASIRDVILHRAQPEMVARVARHSQAIAAALASTPAIAAAPKYVLECVTAAGLVGAALWLYGGSGSTQWLTHLAFLGFAAYRLLPAVQQVFAAVARVHAERAAFDVIADDLRAAHRRALETRPASVRNNGWHGRPQRAIRLIDVSYRHSPERAGGVSDVSLEIPAGTIVGLVGPNGSGKSTLAELVLGLLKPDSGRIEIDGVALDDDNRDSWLDTIAYVPQQITLLDATIARNIAFGVAENAVDYERLHTAARRPRLGPVLEALPDGVNTVIGESGARLSGGQRQRIGIARALYRQASLLVVDEATNALDGLAESEIVALLGALRGRCTVLVIAHRLTAFDACDVLFELDSGRLVGETALSELAPSLRPQGLAKR